MFFGVSVNLYHFGNDLFPQKTCLRWTQDHASPVDHVYVVIVDQAPADGAVAAFLARLQLIQQLEVAWHHCNKEKEATFSFKINFFSDHCSNC